MIRPPPRGTLYCLILIFLVEMLGGRELLAQVPVKAPDGNTITKLFFWSDSALVGPNLPAEIPSPTTTYGVAIYTLTSSGVFVRRDTNTT